MGGSIPTTAHFILVHVALSYLLLHTEPQIITLIAILFVFPSLLPSGGTFSN